MYGNVVTNRQLRSLITSGCVEIRNFDDANLKAAAYTLNPGRILRPSEDGEYEVVRTLTRTRDFVLEPDEYVLVEPKQHVAINADGIIGTFITASTNIENGLLIVAGQIDSKYGADDEPLRFGVKNLLSTQNRISIETRLVHLQFIDLRGSAADPVDFSQQKKQVWDSRKKTENWLEQHGPNVTNATE